MKKPSVRNMGKLVKNKQKSNLHKHEIFKQEHLASQKALE